MARVETARGRTSDRVLCETSNKRDHDKQFLLQWRRGANTPYFQDNSCRGGKEEVARERGVLSIQNSPPFSLF